MYVYNAAWLSLALVLTALCGVLTFLGWRRRGLSALLFGAGCTLLPMALYLTGTLRLVGVLADQLLWFVTGFAFSPKVWAGLLLAGVSAVLIGAARVTRRSRFRSVGARPRGGTPSPEPMPGRPVSGRPVSGRPAGPVDDDLAEIEEILRKRGIT